jgi:hypothetical protein
MKNWMKYGSIGVCFWSLLLVLVGVSQLTFGAYYISKLPIFKIGSPVWIGFLVTIIQPNSFFFFPFHHSSLDRDCIPFFLVECSVRSGSVWSASQNAWIERLPMENI